MDKSGRREAYIFSPLVYKERSRDFCYKKVAASFSRLETHKKPLKIFRGEIKLFVDFLCPASMQPRFSLMALALQRTNKTKFFV